MNRRLLIRLVGASAILVAPAPLAWAANPTRKPSRTRVMIDPGHGGHDPGAIGGRGTLEKTVTLDIARMVAVLLERRGVTAPLTRRDDRFLALGDRVEAARAARADLFVSIHADSAPNTEARGLSAYTLSEHASDAFAGALAQQENAVDRLAAPGSVQKKAVREILFDLAARHTKHASLVAKDAIVTGVGRDLRLLERPMRSANFAVLKAPEVPSLLIETGFLSNPQDEAILRDPRSRRRIAEILAREIAGAVTRAPFI